MEYCDGEQEKVIKLYIQNTYIFSPKSNFPAIKTGRSDSLFFKHDFPWREFTYHSSTYNEWKREFFFIFKNHKSNEFHHSNFKEVDFVFLSFFFVPLFYFLHNQIVIVIDIKKKKWTKMKKTNKGKFHRYFMSCWHICSSLMLEIPISKWNGMVLNVIACMAPNCFTSHAIE